VNAVLVISERDNVATALEPLEAGRVLTIGQRHITLVEPVPRGHKVALCEIGAGDPVVKFGNAIGHASARIAEGAHVHTHNVASARGRGDIAGPAPASAGRIAEPADSDDAAIEAPQRQTA
jgi:SAF domain